MGRRYLWSLLCVGMCLLWARPVEAQKSGVQPNVLVLPQGPGSLGGVGENVKANLNMGLMSYQINILVPKGRGDATPNPSITYSSSAGAGLVGIGWSFSAGSSIERGTVRGLPTYTNKDIFFAGGELVKVPNSPFYRARMEGGFMRYRWVQKGGASDQRGYWLGESPDGSKMYYGANSKGELQLDAQVYGTKGTFRWELVTFVDRNGNRVEYSYFKDGTQSYPDQIAWVFDANDKPLYHLKFQYEDRTDHISDGKPGFDLKTTKRIKEIQITSSGERFRSYTLDFEDSTGLSRLTKVTRYGRDPKLAYPVHFAMKYSNATVSPENSQMVTMPTSLGVDFRSGKIDFVDINGDGLPDVVDTSQPKHVFHINQLTLKDEIKQDKHDFPRSLMVENPTQTSAQLSNASVQMLDFNGDGFTDLVDAVNKFIYINKGNGKWEAQNTRLQSFPVTGKDPNMRFMDYNGDKKIDVISSDGSSTTFWVSDGNGNWTTTPGKVNIGLSFSTDRLRLIDINGDGLQDVVHITKNALRYRKYLGYGEWTQWINVQVPDLDKYELNTKAQFNDINGDGMADMVGFFGNKIVYFVNKNGEAFAKGTELQTFKGIDIPDATKMTIRILDINGNGSRDIVWIDSSGKVVYLELFGKRPNLMTEISNNIGQRINVEYGSSVNFFLRDKTCKVGTDKACAGPWQNKMPMAFTVVTKISTWASRSANPGAQAQPTKEEMPSVQEIYYHNGFYDGVEKKFRGFRKVENVLVGDDDVATRKDTIEFDVGDKDPYFHGKQLRSVTQDLTGKTYRETRMFWKDCGTPAGVDANLDPPARFICMEATETTHIEGESDTSKHKVTREEKVYDGYGNVILDKKLGEKGKDGDESLNRITYIVPTDPKAASSVWLIRAASKVERCQKESGPCTETLYYYDGEAFKGAAWGTIRKGNLSRMTVKKALDSDEVVSLRLRKFDAYGNIVEKRGPLGQRRTIEWDDVYHRFPIKETVHLGGGSSMSVTSKWDYRLGRITSGTDFNGVTSKYTYDSFGRLLSIFQPGDPDDKPSQQFIYELKAPISRIVTRLRTKAGGEQDRIQIQCFDGLGRKLSVRSRVAKGRYKVTSHVTTDMRGQPHQAWDAYEAGEACSFVPPASAQKAPTTFKYDALNRKLRKTFADGTFERFEYKPFVTIHYDEEDTKTGSPHFNTPKTTVTDGLNRILEVREMPKPGETRVTRYTYTNLNAQLKDFVATVTYPNGSVKKRTFNLFGMLIKVEDPDRSTIEFKYNDNGDLIERKDARGVVTLYTYDVHGRILSRQEKGKDETRITYLYDKVAQEMPDATNIKGRVSRVTFPGGMTLYSYSDRGHITLTRTSLLGVDFDTKRTFNNVGDMLSVTYPDGRKLTYTYDDAGRAASIDGFIKSISYQPTGPIKERLAENGTITKYAVDTRGRVSAIDVSSQPGFSYKLSYDAIGNVSQSDETYGDNKISNTYTYDSLYRMTEASLDSAKEVLKYTLDNQDNLSAKISSLGDKSVAHIGDYAYDKKKVHAVTQAGKLQMAYDAAGNMTKRGTHAFTWDYAGRMASSQQEGKEVGRYWYDEARRRTMKLERGVLSLYPSDDFRIHGGEAMLYVVQSSSRIARWSSPAILAKVYDDVAGGKADGKITAADAWVYHAVKSKLSGEIKAALKQRPVELDLARSMLQASAALLLNEGKDEKLFLHTDHLGSIRAVSDSQGKIVEYKRYYPYGALQHHEGEQLTSLGFQGNEYDKAIGAYYFGARYLDPRLAKWMSPDPAFARSCNTQDEWNSYASVANNPMRYRDVDGYASDDATSWDLVAIGTLASVVRSTLAIRGSIRTARLSHKHGKATNYSRTAFAASNVLTTLVGLAYVGFLASGMEGAANIASAVIGGINAVKTAVDIFFTNHQHNQIRFHNNDAYSKRRHRTAVAGRVTSLFAGMGRTALFAAEHYESDKQTNLIMNISALALGAISGIANVVTNLQFRPKVSKANNPYGFRVSSDLNPVFAMKQQRYKARQQSLQDGTTKLKFDARSAKAAKVLGKPK